jgi:hypothetical protein
VWAHVWTSLTSACARAVRLGTKRGWCWNLFDILPHRECRMRSLSLLFARLSCVDARGCSWFRVLNALTLSTLMPAPRISSEQSAAPAQRYPMRGFTLNASSALDHATIATIGELARRAVCGGGGCAERAAWEGRAGSTARAESRRLLVLVQRGSPPPSSELVALRMLLVAALSGHMSGAAKPQRVREAVT